MSDYQDPGWGRALRRIVLRIVIPIGFLFPRAGEKWTDVNGVVVMRILLLTYVVALLLFLLVLRVIVSGTDPQPVPTWMGVAFPAVLIGSLAGVAWARSRPLDLSDEASLAKSYRDAFFLGVAFAEAAALFGFVGVFLVDRLLPYLIGLPVALFGLALIAPTRGNIERRQREITARGSTLNLGQALVSARGR